MPTGVVLLLLAPAALLVRREVVGVVGAGRKSQST
jgi:hypothetical protein